MLTPYSSTNTNRNQGAAVRQRQADEALAVLQYYRIFAWRSSNDNIIDSDSIQYYWLRHALEAIACRTHLITSSSPPVTTNKLRPVSRTFAATLLRASTYPMARNSSRTTGTLNITVAARPDSLSLLNIYIVILKCRNKYNSKRVGSENLRMIFANIKVITQSTHVSYFIPLTSPGNRRSNGPSLAVKTAIGQQ